MVERCLIASADLSELEVLNNAAVGTAVKQIGSAKATRIIVTDTSAKIIFDTVSNDTFGNYALFPEILNALDNNNVFTWNYRDGIMLSRCATPIYIHGRLTGCIYMMEHDP